MCRKFYLWYPLVRLPCLHSLNCSAQLSHEPNYIYKVRAFYYLAPRSNIINDNKVYSFSIHVIRDRNKLAVVCTKSKIIDKQKFAKPHDTK